VFLLTLGTKKKTKTHFFKLKITGGLLVIFIFGSEHREKQPNHHTVCYLSPWPELQKRANRANRANQLVLFFLASANF